MVVIEDNLAELLATNGHQELPAYGKQVSLVRRTSSTVFPTISNRNVEATLCVAARLEKVTALPRAERKASTFGSWMSPATKRVWCFVRSLRTLPITGALSGF